MKQSFYLAFKYLSFYGFRTLILTVSIGLILFLPMGLQRLITESEVQMLSRAEATPLVVGAKGSSTDLVINTLYFERNEIEPIEMNVIDKLNQLGFGYGIPMLSVFKAQGFPIVGTDLDYFPFRGLSLQQGRQLQYLGECILGNAVAEELGLNVGDHLLSSPENFLDLAGVYPLKMKIVGVLNETSSPDDRAVFTDLRTNWVIMGLGHGHQDLQRADDPTLLLKKDSLSVTASPKVYMYNEINEKNMEDFHFHGDTKEYPISSVLFVPDDVKSGTLAQGPIRGGHFQRTDHRSHQGRRKSVADHFQDQENIQHGLRSGRDRDPGDHRFDRGAHPAVAKRRVVYYVHYRIEQIQNGRNCSM